MPDQSVHTASAVRGCHPLNALTPAEIEAAAHLTRALEAWHGECRFESIGTCYPPKHGLHSDAARTWRKAEVCFYDTLDNTLYEAVVDLNGSAVDRVQNIPGARPAISGDEFMMCAQTVAQHSGFIAAMAKRGITDLTHIQVDPFSAGNFGLAAENDRRLVHCLVYYRNNPFDNGYAHPVEGLNVLFDLNRNEVVELIEHGVHEVPRDEANYSRHFPAIREHLRADLQRIDISQPNGPTFTVEDHVVTWLNWRFHVEFHSREGLVLNDIQVRHPRASNGTENWRDLCHRASIAEMVVPYGDPSFNHFRKNAFDVGEYGLGQLANSLTLGCDCRGFIHYFDGVVANTRGEPAVIENAICLHEEDDGMLWKHTDYMSEDVDVRRSRRLVVSMIATVGNYEYGFYWNFYLDGTLELEVKATGIMNTAGVNAVSGDRYGTEVMPGVVAHNHLHLFCARLDMAVDGQQNRLVEVDVVADPPGPDNPWGNAFRAVPTTLAREGGRERNAQTERYWRIESSDRTNALGQPTAYRLHPHGSVRAFNDPGSRLGKRAAFMFKQLWCTPYNEAERYPAGRYVNQSTGEDSIATWTEQGRSVRDTDIVLWHTFGLLHIPRLEDWPVQPVAKTGFSLTADGFFDRNPTLEIPT
ncbi:MAG: primary-amine oxidase [Pseudomonadota bacterium]